MLLNNSHVRATRDIEQILPERTSAACSELNWGASQRTGEATPEQCRSYRAALERSTYTLAIYRYLSL